MLETCVRSNRARCLSAGSTTSCPRALQGPAGRSRTRSPGRVLPPASRVLPPSSAPGAGAPDALLSVVCVLADELEAVLRSLAWQSPSLTAYMKAGIQREVDCQLLTADDMAELMADANACAPKRQKRGSDDSPRSPPAQERERETALRPAHQRTSSDGEEGGVATHLTVASGPLSADRRHSRDASILDAGLFGLRSRHATAGEPPGQTPGGIAHRFQELTLQQRTGRASS